MTKLTKEAASFHIIDGVAHILTVGIDKFHEDSMKAIGNILSLQDSHENLVELKHYTSGYLEALQEHKEDGEDKDMQVSATLILLDIIDLALSESKEA